MSKEVVPITHYPVAEMLPDYLDAERIGVDAGLIGKIAQWGCFQPEVQITGYYGETSKESVGVLDMHDGVAVANRTAALDEAQLSKNKYNLYETAKGLHCTPDLRISVNMSEVEQRVQNSRSPLRDPKLWAHQFDAAVSKGLRDASRAHLLCEGSGFQEVIAAMNYSATYTWLIIPLKFADDTKPLHDVLFANGLGTLAAWLVASNAVKFWRNNFRLRNPPSETCFSLISGYHFDRYATVWSLTRTRRLIRPIK